MMSNIETKVQTDNNDDEIMSKIEQVRDGMQAVHDSCVNHTFQWRREQLDKLELMIHKNINDFVNALATDLGCTNVEAKTLHVEMILADIKECRKQMKTYCTTKRIGSPLAMAPSFSDLSPMPLNSPAVLILGPSNYPLSLCLQPAAGALAAGNPIIIKPSEHCPTVSGVIHQYINQYFDPSIAYVIQGAVPETTALLAKSWGLIFFTGSPNVGRIVASAAAKTLTPTVLELGGKSPCIIDPETMSSNSITIDWSMIANRISWSKFMNAGQTCAATDTLILSPDALDKLEPYLITSIQEQYGKDTALTTPSPMGRIITHHAAQRLYSLIDQVEEYIKSPENENPNNTKKCRILFGGTKYCNVKEKFIAPTIIINPPLRCDLMKEEVFGPILPIITVADRDELYQFVHTNMPPTPLIVYIFTSSDRVYREYCKRLRAGSTMRNDCLVQLSSTVIPFGGLGTSGYGSYHGKYSLETFTHWTPSMYRPLIPGCDLNKVRFHPFIPGTLKQFLVSHLSWFPNIPPLYCKEIIALGAIVTASAVVGVFLSR